MLTFDDGPDEKYTPEILDIIKKYNVRFFPDKKTVDIKDLLPNEVAWADGRAILSGRVQVKARGMKSSEGDVVFPATLTEEEHQ